MITWVLILMVFTVHGVAATSVVFHSPQSCQAAIDQAYADLEKDHKAQAQGVVAYCVKDMNINS